MAAGRIGILVAVLLVLATAGACGRTTSGAVPGVKPVVASALPVGRVSPDGGAACLDERAICGRPESSICCAGLRCVLYTIYDYERCLVPKKAGEPCVFSDQCESRSCNMGGPGCGP